MKVMAALLVAAAFSAPGAWDAGPASSAALHLFPSEMVVQPPGAAPDVPLHIAANFDDKPTPIPPRLRPFDAVGRIENIERTRMGTGFLIGPCTVLTAYHVLFPAGETPSTKAKFRFAIGHGGTTAFTSVMPASPVLWGDFSYAVDTPTEDFAVLNVPACPGRKFSTIPLAPMSLTDIAQSGGKLRNAGYPVGRSRGRVWGDEDCSVGGMHPLEPELFAIDCYSMPGMSGGPVLAERDGQLMAVAIMSRAVLYSGSDSADGPLTGTSETDLARYNEALPVSEFLAKLRDMGLVGP